MSVTREQAAVIEHIANAYGSAQVTPVPKPEAELVPAAVLVRGWEGEPDTGRALTPGFLIQADCDPAEECALLDAYGQLTGSRAA